MKIVSKKNVESTGHDKHGFACERYKFAAESGGHELGASLYVLEPGKAAWPAHSHLGNEEAIYVVHGRGTLRHAAGESKVQAGDFVSFARGRDNYHQIVNDSDAKLEYLCVSTMNDPDVTVYPRSEKIGVFAGSAPGGRGEREVHGYYRENADVDYWSGEDGER